MLPLLTNNSVIQTSESNLIRACKKRWLRIKKEDLAEWKISQLVPTVTNSIHQTEKQINIYDISQIVTVKLALKGEKEFLSTLNRILPFLWNIRYFYQDEVFGFVSSALPPPLELSEEEKMEFRLNPRVTQERLKEIFIPHDWLEKHELSREAIKNTRDQLIRFGHWIDPMKNWYSFLKTIRLEDPNKFKWVEGDVLLAHDFYLLAEILTLFYKDCFGEIIDPEDMYDGRGGSWKKHICEACKQEYKAKNVTEKYCEECKLKIINGGEVSIICTCGEKLVKLADGDIFYNKTFYKKAKTFSVDGRKSAPVGIYTKLLYGKMLFNAKCECGNSQIMTFDKGWD